MSLITIVKDYSPNSHAVKCPRFGTDAEYREKFKTITPSPNYHPRLYLPTEAPPSSSAPPSSGGPPPTSPPTSGGPPPTSGGPPPTSGGPPPTSGGPPPTSGWTHQPGWVFRKEALPQVEAFFASEKVVVVAAYQKPPPPPKAPKPRSSTPRGRKGKTLATSVPHPGSASQSEGDEEPSLTEAGRLDLIRKLDAAVRSVVGDAEVDAMVRSANPPARQLLVEYLDHSDHYSSCQTEIRSPGELGAELRRLSWDTSAIMAEAMDPAMWMPFWEGAVATFRPTPTSRLKSVSLKWV